MYKKFHQEVRAEIAHVLSSGYLSSLLGNRVSCFEDLIARYLRVKYAVAVNSGTAALFVALKSLGIGRGDDVIVPNLTFMATASTVKMVEANPILVDVVKDGFTIDPEEIEKKITDDTTAIIPVHLCGIPAYMDIINEIAEDYGLFVIEDACQALGSTYEEELVGTLGDVGCFSFYGSKIIPIGEGGMIVTNNIEVYQEALKLRNHGKLYKQPIKEIGYNLRMPEVCGAIGSIYALHFKEIRQHYKKLHLQAREKYWIERKPNIPLDCVIISRYIPFINKHDKMINTFYRPLNTMSIFLSTEEFPNSRYMWNRAEKKWLD